MVFPQTILPIRAELFINGAWVNITSYVYFRDGTAITRGRSDEGADVNPAALNLTLNNRDGRFSPRNPTGVYYGLIGRNTPIRVSVQIEDGWLQINQATNATVTPTYVTTTDKAALDITGDIDIRFDADLDSWQGQLQLVSKWTETGNQKSWMLFLHEGGQMTLYRTTDGVTVGGATSTVPVPIINGRMAVRATLDVNDGAGGRVTTFYIAPTLAGPWTQLGDQVVGVGTITIFSGTSPVYLLDSPGVGFGHFLTRGRVYGAEVYSGIAGTRVANPNFASVAEGATSFVDSHSNTWNLTGDLNITDYDSRFIGEVTAFPQRWDVTGRDVYSQIQAYGVLRRMSQGSSVGSPLYRGITRDPNTLSYWAMEDESGATFLSGIGGGDIRASATTDPAGESGFVSSGPVAVVGTSALAATPNTYVSTGNVQVKMLLHVPDAGLGADVTLFTVTTAGTAPAWDVVVSAAGDLSIVAKDSDGITITTIGPLAFAINGQFLQIKLILENDGADVQADLTTLTQGTATIFDMTGVVSSRQVGRVTRITLNPKNSAAFDGVAIGHLALSASLFTTWNEIYQINGWSGETALDRFVRLCAEEGVAFCQIGPNATGDSTTLGVQPSDSLLNLLRQAAEADGGILFEGREFLELRYRPRRTIYSQQSDVSLDYESHQMDLMEPTEDDQLTKNDVTVSRIGGGSARAELTTGALSVADPTDSPPGVGRYNASFSLSLESDSLLRNHANWRMRLGTVDEARYPQVSLSIESGHFSALLLELARLDLGDRLSILSPPAWLDQRDVKQIVQGYTEELNSYRHGLTFNLSPALPWDVGVWDDFYEEDRYGNGGCVTTEALDTTETGIDVLTDDDHRRWSATAVPYDVAIGGEVITITSVSGSTNTQTLTGVRSVNGVVKSHLSGATVELATLSYYGL